MRERGHRADRSGGGQPLPLRRPPSPSPTARSRTPSRTSTSAARPCCAPRPRTTRASRSWSIRPTTRACSTSCATGGAVGEATRFALAKKVFAHTAAYDGAIANYLFSARRRAASAPIPRRAEPAVRTGCRRCATARTRTRARRSTATSDPVAGSLASYRQLQGKELSYNNIADADAAWEMREELLDEPACVIIKHANPCGVAIGEQLLARLSEGLQTDPRLGLRRHHRLQPRARSRRRPRPTGQQFVEVIIAPRVEPEARELLAAKKNLRVLEVPISRRRRACTTASASAAACWCRAPTPRAWHASDLKVVTQEGAQRRAVDGPAVRLARGEVREVECHRVLRRRHDARRGRGPDEPRRQRAHRRDQGAERRPVARRLGRRLGCLLPVPRRRSTWWSMRAPAAVIQPGGSVRDDEVIAAADERGVAMVFTGDAALPTLRTTMCCTAA